MPTPAEQLASLISSYLTEDQGEKPPAAAVVAALATAGIGILRTGAGVGLPIAKITQMKGLAAYLVSHYLAGTRPSPANNYLGQMAQFTQARLAKEAHPVPITQLGLWALAALALGHCTEFMPPMARASCAVRFAELYIAGV